MVSRRERLLAVLALAAMVSWVAFHAMAWFGGGWE